MDLVALIVAIVAAVLALMAVGATARAWGHAGPPARRRGRPEQAGAELELRDVRREGDRIALQLVNTGPGDAYHLRTTLVVRDREVPGPSLAAVASRRGGGRPASLALEAPGALPEQGLPPFWLRVDFDDELGAGRTTLRYAAGSGDGAA